jgi:hypothetical protein
MPRLSHDDRELLVITDVEASFPNFAGTSASWNKIPDGQDPPDFISAGSLGSVGLELVEWLDGEQMTAAKGRESQRDQAHRVLAVGWKNEYQPKNFRGAFLEIGSERITHKDEAALRKEFYALAEEVDHTWNTNPDRIADNYEMMEFPGYPLIQKYFSIRFIGGTMPEPHSWIHPSGDGGGFDPADAASALKAAIGNKLALYAKPESQERLKLHNLSSLNLLVHGGFNAFAYNTPSGPLTMEDLSRLAAAYLGNHPQREIFDRVWFFDSLGNDRWLCELSPRLHVYRKGE